MKLFSRLKGQTEENPIIEKNYGKKGNSFEESIIEEPIIEQPITKAPIIEEQLPETFEVDDNFLYKLNNFNYQKEDK